MILSCVLRCPGFPSTFCCRQDLTYCKRIRVRCYVMVYKWIYRMSIKPFLHFQHVLQKSYTKYKLVVFCKFYFSSGNFLLTYLCTSPFVPFVPGKSLSKTRFFVLCLLKSLYWPSLNLTLTLFQMFNIRIWLSGQFVLSVFPFWKKST